jgi:long-subunit acyl-CoA synthetase (AMP-forming)
MLTPTLKLKRRNILQAYADDMAELYEERVPLGADRAAE